MADRHSTPLTPNNFDLLRLLAATQVMVAHYDHYLLGRSGVLEFFPGVPVFFFISGFLISASWERSVCLGDYVRNRALRIFPALCGVWAFTLTILLIFYDRELLFANWLRLIAWSVMQVTILQDWYPAIFNGFGTGVLNGSLWTIPVELGFYFLLPLLYLVMKSGRKPALVLVITVLTCWALLIAVTLPSLAGGSTRWMDWISLSPLPWFGMFAMGVLAQRKRDWLLNRLQGKFLPVLIAYAAFALLAARFPLYPLLRSDGNAMGILNYLLLCAVVMAGAHTGPELAGRILRRNDISYGIYLFHMPLLNLLLQLHTRGTAAYALGVTGSILLAGISWFLVEKPFLNVRHRPLFTRER